jgi:hypothetical protein
MWMRKFYMSTQSRTLTLCLEQQILMREKLREEKHKRNDQLSCLAEQRNTEERTKICGSHQLFVSLLISEESWKEDPYFFIFQLYPCVCCFIMAKSQLKIILWWKKNNSNHAMEATTRWWRCWLYVNT